MHQPVQSRIVGRQAPHHQRRFFSALAISISCCAASTIATGMVSGTAGAKYLRAHRFARVATVQLVGDATQHTLLVGGRSRPADLRECRIF